MLKIIPFLPTILFLSSLNAQDTIRYLEGNNISAAISNSSTFFHDYANSRSGYEIPKGSTNNLIYSMSFSFGAKDAFGNLKMAGSVYSIEEYRETYPGALTADGSAEAIEPGFATDVYVVSRAEIEYHAANFYTPGYVAPYGISNWPAHGDVALGLDYQLAPFADLNGNFAYEPELGEYPEIRGDHAAYLIMNDKAGPHGWTGGEPLGIEIHYMFYQFESDDDIDNTTFINVRVINRSTQNYPEFIVGQFLDADIGYGLNGDDMVGTNADNNLIFTYNGDNFDHGGGIELGYGENPPAIGVMTLNHKMNVGMSFERDASPYGNPVSPLDFWNYMHANWRNGVHITKGGIGRDPDGVPTNYMYDGNPNEFDDLSEWNEVNVGNSKGDRRLFMASESNVLNAGESLCYDYAVITSRIGNNFENAEGLILQAPSIQAFYDALPNIYCDFTLTIDESVSADPINIFPNPSNGTFTVDLVGNFDLEMFGIDGRSVYSEQNVQGSAPITTNLVDGTYLITVTQNTKSYQSKIVIRN